MELNIYEFEFDACLGIEMYTMRTNLPKTLDLLIFSIFLLNFSLQISELLKFSHNLPKNKVNFYHPKGVKHYILTY